MPITLTLEGEDEARVSDLVDRGVFPSALAAVQGALRLAEAATAESVTAPDDAERSDPQPR